MLTIDKTFPPMDPYSSTCPTLDHNSSIHSHTNPIRVHLVVLFRYIYTYTPSPSHSPILLDRLLDRHSNLLLLGNLGCWRMGSGLSENGVICSWVDSFYK